MMKCLGIEIIVKLSDLVKCVSLSCWALVICCFYCVVMVCIFIRCGIVNVSFIFVFMVLLGRIGILIVFV